MVSRAVVRVVVSAALPHVTTAGRAELAAVKLLLQAMKNNGATAYLVNIMSGSARFARDERFGFCGRYRNNATERDASVVGCMSRARVLLLGRNQAQSCGRPARTKRLIGRGWPKLGAACRMI